MMNTRRNRVRVELWQGEENGRRRVLLVKVDEAVRSDGSKGVDGGGGESKYGGERGGARECECDTT